jgi:hypothetical protein
VGQQFFIQIQLQQTLQAVIDVEKIQTPAIRRHPIIQLHVLDVRRHCPAVHGQIPYADVKDGNLTEPPDLDKR